MIGITEIREALLTKKISCAELTAMYIEAAKRDNAELNAFTLITEGEALRAAAEVDKKIAGGEELHPLAGVPFVLKDCISTEDIRTTCASKMLESYVPVFNADTWEKLRAAGAVMVGKGNMDEFSMGSTSETSYFGAVKNPHDLSRVPGGSSGGSAAAVAASLSVFGIGTDSAGSVRQPAAHCGVVGIKPTYGAVSRFGLIANVSSFDQIGVLTTCVRDAAAVLDAISGRDERDMTSRDTEKLSGMLSGSVKGMKIGVVKEFFEGIAPDVEKAVRDSVAVFEKLGATVVETSFPLLGEAVSASVIIACAEVSSNLGRFDGLRFGHRAEDTKTLDEFISRTRAEGFGGEVQRRVLLGTYALMAGQYEKYFVKAQKLRRAVSGKLTELLAEFDVLLTPTAAATAPVSGEKRTPASAFVSDRLTAPANLAELPAVSLPCGFGADGMPVGMQIIGGKFREKTILDAALAFETETAGQYLRTAGYGVKL